MAKELKSPAEFDWYKLELDVAVKHKHRHDGAPERYPCLVDSKFWDDPNGPYTYDHTFVYQHTVTCEHCGHVKTEWDYEAAHDES